VYGSVHGGSAGQGVTGSRQRSEVHPHNVGAALAAARPVAPLRIFRHIIPSTMPPPERKRIRLPESVYRETGRLFSVTIATSPRSPGFSDVPFGLDCVRCLRDVRDKTGTRIYAYCLMPDHVHLLLGIAPRTSLPAVIGSWKSLCFAARRKRGIKELFWQRSFYDRALRKNEDFIDAPFYILGNPVRAGLVADFHDYALCGSMEFDV
jgi:putative transposase